MARGIIAKKIGMTQIFDADGKVVPVTVLQAGPCTVTRVKTDETDGYKAVQLGFQSVREKLLTKPRLGHLKKAGLPVLRILREFRNVEGEFQSGQEVRADIFQSGDMVKVSGISKGKGYQGVIKRHGFHGGRMTHGSKFHRAPGSTSANTFPARVFKGKKMPGHAGARMTTTTNLEVAHVDLQNNLLMIKGSVPGPRTAIVTVEAMK